MPTQEEVILSILTSKLSELAVSLQQDTRKNYREKVHNWLLSGMSPQRTLEMVFTSSFESKSGNTLEACARLIAKARYGDDAIPLVIKGLGATDEDVAQYLASQKSKSRKPKKESQVILTRKKLVSVTEYVTHVMNQNIGAGITQQVLKDEIVNHSYEDDNTLYAKPADLFIQLPPPQNAVICMEIKAGGELDSTKGPGDIAKLLTVCAVGRVTEGYFATLYNKNGEGRRFTGTVTKYLADDMILAGSAFWNKILPSGISFGKFREIYSQALAASGVFDKMTCLSRKSRHRN